MTIWQCVRILRKPFTIVTQEVICARDHMPGIITCVATRVPVAALTFDDGPHPEYTPRLLDILEQYQVHATFFMVGEAAHKHPELVLQVAQGGHAIGNHSWDHPSFPSLPGRERRKQLRACAQALAPYGQPLFRPPYGDQSLASHLDALWLRYRVVTWNLHAEDWCEHDADWMADRLTRGIQPGSIVLLHDAIYRSRQLVPQYNRESMLTAVTLFLERLDGRFRFITIPELLHYGHPR
jgi:peptidoglycan/xylan/chitin deacetylase (PgdA/CDA1 family)